MDLQPVIALDIGHSACKVIACANGRRERLLFPSVVTSAVEIAEDSAAADALRETIEVGGRRFFFGDTAVVQGVAEAESGMAENWISHPHHQVLLLGALRKVKQAFQDLDPSKAILVLGLPAQYYSAQRNTLLSSMRNLVPGAQVVVLPQPLAPYLAIQYAIDGREDRARPVAAESWAVLEVGHFTLDVCLIAESKWVERAKGSCAGAYRLVEALAAKLSQRIGSSVSMLEAQRALASGYVRVFGRKEDIAEDLAAARREYAEEVLEFAAMKLDRDARSLDGILVAGGGAQLIYDRVRDRWPNATLAAHGRFDVAEGYARSGLALARDNHVRLARKATAGASA